MSGGPIAAIVLAAGGSTRLGLTKQLVRYEGCALSRRAAATALAAGFDPVFVVLGADADACAEELRGLPVEIVRNANWQTGLASSIRAGLDAIGFLTLAPEAVLISLCDQPLISAEMLRSLRLAHEHSGARIVAAEYAGTHGAPALFHASLFGELRALSGDEGARKLFAKFAGEVAAVPIPAAAHDLDTPADHARLRAAT